MNSPFLVFDLIAENARFEVKNDTSSSAFAGPDKSNDIRLSLDHNRLTKCEQQERRLGLLNP
jgi:hypothetical protein